MFQFGLLGLLFLGLLWYRHIMDVGRTKFPLLTDSSATEPAPTKIELLVSDDWSNLEHAHLELRMPYEHKDSGPAMNVSYQDEYSSPNMSIRDNTDSFSSLPPLPVKLKSSKQVMSKTIPSLKSLRNEVDPKQKDIRYIINDDHDDDMVLLDKVEVISHRVVDKGSLPVGFQNLTKYLKHYVQSNEKPQPTWSFAMKPSAMIAYIEDLFLNALNDGNNNFLSIVGMLTVIISILFVKKTITTWVKIRQDYTENKAKLTMAKSCVDGVNTLLKEAKKEFRRQSKLEEYCAETKLQALDKLDEMAVRIQSLFEDQEQRIAHNISQLTRAKMAALNEVVNAFNSREMTFLETEEQVKRRKQLQRERMAVMDSLTDLQCKSSSSFMNPRHFSNN